MSYQQQRAQEAMLKEVRQLKAQIKDMYKKRIDPSTVKTFSNYAKIIKRSVPRVYQLESEGKIKTIEVDGVKFVDLRRTNSINK